jgi:hypothetical protein
MSNASRVDGSMASYLKDDGNAECDLDELAEKLSEGFWAVPSKLTGRQTVEIHLLALGYLRLKEMIRDEGAEK